MLSRAFLIDRGRCCNMGCKMCPYKLPMVVGKLKTEKTKIIVELSREFGDYYYSLIPQYKQKQRQKYITHCTVVRGFEKANIQKDYSDYITLFYSPFVEYDDRYYFLNCWSKELCDIREECGLPRYRDGRTSFHITIGNMK